MREYASSSSYAEGVKAPFLDGRICISAGCVRFAPSDAANSYTVALDIRTKCLRSNTAVNVVAATFEGLKALRTPEEVARTRGKTTDEIVG